MAVNIRPPSISALDERGQMAQVKSYLYQLAEQLNFALNSLDAGQSGQAQTPIIMVSGGSSSSANTPSVASVDAEAAFDDIKALIIKSADIVDAYYEEIHTRLSGAYVAESDFGSYAEQTEHNISQTSTEIESIYDHIQVIVSDIENIEYNLIDTHAHIRSGLLYYDEDEVPVYGLEIGQKNTIDGEEVFNKYARFTSGRLSFYDQNNTEVAYISDYKLYITRAEVTGSLKLGGFLIDTSKGLTLKWVGRG